MRFIRCNAATFPLVVFAVLVATHVIGPDDDELVAFFLAVEAVAVKITIQALVRKYRHDR